MTTFHILFNNILGVMILETGFHAVAVVRLTLITVMRIMLFLSLSF